MNCFIMYSNAVQYIWTIDKIIGGFVLKIYYFLGETADSRAGTGKNVSLECLVVPELGSAPNSKG